MKIAIMQPYIFPYIGYFQLIAAADKFILYDDVSFINKGWINRNNILVNGQSHMFTIPLKKASQNKPINEIEVSEDIVWKEKLLKSIKQSYSKAPQFDEVFNLIEKVLGNRSGNVSGFIHNSLIKTLAKLNIDTQIIASSSVYNNSGLKAQERIIDICKRENADTYINPSGGVELYSESKFAANNINLKFLKPLLKPYRQFTGNFIPGLSILDVMMFNSSEEMQKLLYSYELIDHPHKESIN